MMKTLMTFQDLNMIQGWWFWVCYL